MIGETLGPYRVLEKLGEGGMGEVYRARDPKLARDVALKVLPESFASDPERLGRFEREARALASLNHPNIAQIYEIEEAPPPSPGQSGVRALVMEFVEGEDLAGRLARGPMSADEALPIVRQIAEALDAAHGAGIVHRDLKPANVMVRDDGTVKLLDFGVARALDAAGPVSEPTGRDPGNMPTVTTPAEMTRAGVILGTAAYMAPEQARGKPVDDRADIWAFGCVLYEMLTGRRLFAGETVSEVLAAVLRQEIEWTALPADTPEAVRRLLARCLVRDPKRRLRDIGDALLDLEPETGPGASAGTAPVAGVARRRSVLAWFAGIAAAALLGVVGGWLLRVPPAPTMPVTRFEVHLPASHTLYVGLNAGLALSPDGQRVAIGAFATDSPELLVRTLDEFAPHVLPGTEHGTTPFFSPDGQWIGYLATDRKLRKVRASGGQPEVISAAPAATAGAWGPTGTIVFDSPTGLMQVSADGGTPAPLTKVATGSGEIGHLAPRWLPDGRAVLFTVLGRAGSQLAVVPAEGGAHRTLLDGTTALGIVEGRLVHGCGSAIVATPFDLEHLTAGAPAQVLVTDVRRAGPRVLADLATNGTLAFQPAFSSDYALVWLTRAGLVVPAFGERAAYDAPRLAPDGGRVAVGISDDDGGSDVWIVDLQRGTRVRLTSDGRSRFPIWLRDGKRVLVTTTRDDGRSEVRSLSSDGTASPEVVGASERLMHAESVSPDGGVLAVAERIDGAAWPAILGRRHFSFLPLGDTRRLSLSLPEGVVGAVYSPDGRWLACAADESGLRAIHLIPAHGTGPRVLVSSSGGWQPAWSPDGHELYYRASNRIMRVGVDPVTGRVSQPTPLFDSAFTSFRGSDLFRAQYDVARDGRFLMVRSEGPRDQVRVVLNLHTVLQQPSASGPR